MKKYSLLGLFVLSGILTFSAIKVVQMENSTKNPPINNTSTTLRSVKPYQNQPAQAQSLAFEYTVTSEMLNDKQESLNKSVFIGKITLKQDTEKNIWLGQVTDAKLNQQDRSIKFTDVILFKTQYQGFVFKNTDLLGLPVAHPANAIRYLLKQLSYQSNGALAIEDASNINRYRYNIDENKVTRQLIERKEKNINAAIAANIFVEKWSLLLSTGYFPKQLTATLESVYHNKGSQFTVKQAIRLNAFDSKISWSKSNFANDANANLLTKNTAINVNFSITSEDELMKALLKLVSLTDETLAKAVGKYLLENYSTNDIVTLINQQNTSSKIASLIIYSIQKNSTFPAEVMLVNLLAHAELPIENKQRVVMSLGRFEAVSDLSINHLTELAQQPDNQLANTAQLSVGTIARYNKEQQYKVKDFLFEQLTQGHNTAVTLLAINNSGINDLNEQVVTLLGDKEANTNVALIKLLANDTKYHAKVVDFAVHSNQAKSINELTRALTSKKIVLTAKQKEQILARLETNVSQLIKDQLTNLLNAGDKQW